MENEIELRKRRIRVRTVNSIFKNINRWNSHHKCIHPYKKMFMFTDNYQMYWLKEDLPELPHWTNKANIPRSNLVEKLLSTTKEIIKNPEITLSIDVDIINQSVKSRSKLVNIAGVYFNPKMVRDLIRILDTSTDLKMQIVITSSGKKISGKLVAKSKHGYGLVLSHAIYITNDNSMHIVASKDVVYHMKGVE